MRLKRGCGAQVVRLAPLAQGEPVAGQALGRKRQEAYNRVVYCRCRVLGRAAIRPGLTFVAREKSVHPLLGVFGMVGGLELIIVMLVMMLLFGHRLPSVMRSLGQGITEFKKGIRDDQANPDKSITHDKDEH